MVPRRLCICSLCVILACAPMNGIQQLVHSAPQSSPQKTQEVSRSYAQKWSLKDHSQKFPDYWWPFQTQKLLRYSTKLAEERSLLQWADQGHPITLFTTLHWCIFQYIDVLTCVLNWTARTTGARKKMNSSRFWFATSNTCSCYTLLLLLQTGKAL